MSRLCRPHPSPLPQLRGRASAPLGWPGLQTIGTPQLQTQSRSLVPFQAWQLCAWEQHPAVAVLVSLLRSLYCPPVSHLEGQVGLGVGTEGLPDALLLSPCSACSALPQTPIKPVATPMPSSSALVHLHIDFKLRCSSFGHGSRKDGALATSPFRCQLCLFLTLWL